jgi:hypothetical protein
MADDVQLADLELVQRYSLAVRTESAPRDELVAALEADLAWLTGGRRASAAGSTSARPAATRPAARKAVRKTAARRPPEA